jgi:hypothetical protein
MVSKVGTGAGTVTSSPAGINCGADCSEAIAHGASVTLTAAAATGSTFGGWSGGGCSGVGTCVVTVTSATTVTATFTANLYTLMVTKSGAGSGTVTSSPAGISCGTDCTETIAHGSSVTLTAAPGAGSTFAGWSGGGCTGVRLLHGDRDGRDHGGRGLRGRDLRADRVQDRRWLGHRDLVAGGASRVARTAPRTSPTARASRSPQRRGRTRPSQAGPAADAPVSAPAPSRSRLQRP